jgi:hypothetical protein
LVPTNAGAVSVRVVVVLVVVVVAVVAVVGVVLVVGVTVLVAVVLVVGGFALVLVLDEREVVADAVALAVVRLAEDVGVAVTEAGLLEPQAAISVASAMPSPSAVEVGRIFIGRGVTVPVRNPGWQRLSSAETGARAMPRRAAPARRRCSTHRRRSSPAGVLLLAALALLTPELAQGLLGEREDDG